MFSLMMYDNDVGFSVHYCNCSRCKSIGDMNPFFCLNINLDLKNHSDRPEIGGNRCREPLFIRYESYLGMDMYKILVFVSDTSGTKRVLSDVFLQALSENHYEKFFGVTSCDKNHNLRENFQKIDILTIGAFERILESDFIIFLS